MLPVRWSYYSPFGPKSWGSEDLKFDIFLGEDEKKPAIVHSALFPKWWFSKGNGTPYFRET